MSKTTRNISIQTLLRETSSLRADIFWKKYENKIHEHEWARETLSKYQSGKVDCCLALAELQERACKALVEAANKKQQNKRDFSLEPKKRFECKIFNKFDNIEFDEDGEELAKTFDLPQDAARWGDNKIIDGTEGWYAVVYDNGKYYEKIVRGDSFARVFRRVPGMVCKRIGKHSNVRLRGRMKVKG